MDLPLSSPIYTLYHSMDRTNMQLAQQLAQSQDDQTALSYMQGVETAIRHILQTDFYAYLSETPLLDNLQQGFLTLSGIEIPPHVAYLAQILRSLIIQDERDAARDNIYWNFEPDLRLLLPRLPLLQSLVWSTTYPIHLNGQETWSQALQLLSLSSKEHIDIAALPPLPALRTLCLCAPDAHIHRMESFTGMLHLMDIQHTTTLWKCVAAFPHITGLSLTDCALHKWHIVLRQYTQLEELAIFQNDSLFNLPDWLPELSRLKRLRFQHCSGLPFSAFERLANQFPHLELLDLRHTLHEGRFVSCDGFEWQVQQIQNALPAVQILID